MAMQLAAPFNNFSDKCLQREKRNENCKAQSEVLKKVLLNAEPATSKIWQANSCSKAISTYFFVRLPILFYKYRINRCLLFDLEYVVYVCI